MFFHHTLHGYIHSHVLLRSVALPTLGGQYPVFSAGPGAKLMEEGKVHTVEHLINPLTMQHAEHSSTPTGATVLPAVSTPPPFQVWIIHLQPNTLQLN